MAEEIAVSVICNAYNHEKYIKSALEGFIMQKTDFKFEVLVHDDASTDKTAEIIREYEKRYPEIIKPIYQTENQYSKGGGRVSAIQLGRVKGKYIAICEGDDYWIDPLKLQKQYDVLEKNPDIDICAHASKCEVGGEFVKYIKPFDEDCVIPIETVLKGNGFDLVSTATLFYRAELNENMPDFRKHSSIDYALQVNGAEKGGMLYLSDCMSVYRKFTESSWSRAASNDVYRHTRFREKTLRLYMEINEHFNYKYNNIMSRLIRARLKGILLYIYCNKPELSREYREKYKGILSIHETFYVKAFVFAYRLRNKLRGKS